MTDQLAIFKALANPDRLKIMELLAATPSLEMNYFDMRSGKVFYTGFKVKPLDGTDVVVVQPVSLPVLEIARHVQLSQSQTSQHLATLRRAGLIISKRSGNTILNGINPAVNWPVKVFK